MNNVHLVVNIRIKKEYTNEVLEAFQTLHTLTHKEDRGCIRYDMHQVKEEENSFCLLETWEDAACLEEHKAKKHFSDFVDFAEGKLDLLELKEIVKL